MENKYIKAELGITYYKINRDDRSNNIDKHHFLIIKILGIIKHTLGFAIILCDKEENINLELNSDIIHSKRYKQPKINEIIEIIPNNKRIEHTYIIHIPALDKMPKKLIINGRDYCYDKSLLKNELLDLLEGQLIQVSLDAKVINNNKYCLEETIKKLKLNK